MKHDPPQTPKLVRDLMTVGVETCGSHTPVTTIAQALLQKDLEAVVVLDNSGHALGIVGQNELIKAYGRDNYLDLTADDILSEGVPQIPSDIPLKAAALMMKDAGIRAFFLMHHSDGIEYPAAVISYKHFLRHMTMENVDDIQDLGFGAKRDLPLETFIEKRDSNKS